jgi:hypothetical protein
MEIQVAKALVINAPEIFKDPAFQGWLNSDLAKFTWHKPGTPVSEWSDVVTLIDPTFNGEGIGGEGSDSDMPEHIWNQLVQACKDTFGTNGGNTHIMVRLTNLEV